MNTSIYEDDFEFICVQNLHLNVDLYVYVRIWIFEYILDDSLKFFVRFYLYKKLVYQKLILINKKQTKKHLFINNGVFMHLIHFLFGSCSFWFYGC